MTKLQQHNKLYQQVRPTTCSWIITRFAQDRILVGVQMKKHDLLQKAKEHMDGYTEYGALPTSFEISASYNKFYDITWSSLPLILRLIFYFQFQSTWIIYIYDMWIPHKCIKIPVLWDLTPCSLVDKYHHFRGTCCLHLQGILISAEYFLEEIVGLVTHTHTHTD